MPRLLAVALTFAVASSASAQIPHGATWPVEEAEAQGYPYNVPYGGWPPGGYEARVGSPYYWSVPGGTTPLASVGGAAGFRGGPHAADASDCDCRRGGAGAGSFGREGHGGPFGHAAYGATAPGHGFDPSPANAPNGRPAGDPYTYHFGPGFYRAGEFGHYRFPYYSYRRPWYDVGHPTYVRDTNLPW